MLKFPQGRRRPAQIPNAIAVHLDYGLVEVGDLVDGRGRGVPVAHHPPGNVSVRCTITARRHALHCVPSGLLMQICRPTDTGGDTQSLFARTWVQRQHRRRAREHPDPVCTGVGTTGSKDPGSSLFARSQHRIRGQSSPWHRSTGAYLALDHPMTPADRSSSCVKFPRVARRGWRGPRHRVSCSRSTLLHPRPPSVRAAVRADCFLMSRPT